MSEVYKLYSAKGSGGSIIELLLELSKAPHEITYFEWDELRVNSEYKKINPLSQVPGLVLPDGRVMTESLAIAMYLDNQFKMKLAPMDNPVFLRWSVFLVGSIYPTFTFGDVPKTWVTNPEAQKELTATTDEARKKMWLQVEEAASDEKWFLGKELSLVDIYMSVMYEWRPGKAWFDSNCPKLSKIAKTIQNRQSPLI